MTRIPACHRCGEPCLQVYAIHGEATVRVPFEDLERTRQPADPRIIWLCADCVDEVAEAMA